MGHPEFAAPLIVANEEHRFVIAEQLREIGVVPDALMLEPVGRNTAPAACVAALRLAAGDPGALMLVMPSDHAIPGLGAFRQAIERAAAAARGGHLVTVAAKTPSPAHLRDGFLPLPHCGRGVKNECFGLDATTCQPDQYTSRSRSA